jgi:hypothetical protein
VFFAASLLDPSSDGHVIDHLQRRLLVIYHDLTRHVDTGQTRLDCGCVVCIVEILVLGYNFSKSEDKSIRRDKSISGKNDDWRLDDYVETHSSDLTCTLNSSLRGCIVYCLHLGKSGRPGHEISNGSFHECKFERPGFQLD